MKTFEVDDSCGLDAIKHSGIIKKIDERFFYVSIVAQSACAACHSKGVCNVSEMNEEVVEVPRTDGMNYTVGERVQVVMRKALGTKAVILGYIFPFLLVLLTLVIALGVTGNEALSGLLALGILVPYYLVLNAARKRLRRTFVFSIQ